jgi:hypothetical protein
VGYCDNRDVILKANEDDAVREIVYWQLAHIRVFNAGNEPSCIGELLEVAESLINFSRKPIGDLRITLAVPTDGILKLALRPLP